MEPEKQVGVRGKAVTAQSREVIANVLKFMMKEAESGTPLVPLAHYKQRLMLATGVSEKIYRQVLKETRLIEQGKLGGFTSPSRKNRCKNEEVVEVILLKNDE